MDFYKLSKTVLFQGTTPEETEQMLSCLKAGKRKYKKEEMIYRAGKSYPVSALFYQEVF